MTHDRPDLGADGPAALARYTREATLRGRIVAREVCAEPLEELHAAGQLTDAQYEAGRRLRAALTGSWPQPRISTRWGYTSDASDLDNDGEPVTDEEAWERRTRHHETWRQAERIIGRECWPVVEAVCRGYRFGSQGRPDLLRRGLSVMVAEWRLTR